jgi:hypothetical protein
MVYAWCSTNPRDSGYGAKGKDPMDLGSQIIRAESLANDDQA